MERNEYDDVRTHRHYPFPYLSLLLMMRDDVPINSSLLEQLGMSRLELFGVRSVLTHKPTLKTLNLDKNLGKGAITD